MRSKEILKDLDDTSSELLQIIQSFDQEQFNTIPFEGSWTAGQTAEHLLKSNISKLLHGNMEETERQPDEKIQKIKDIFLNFDIKMTAPGFNTPSIENQDKGKILASLTDAYKEAEEAAAALDLSETCLDFELPRLGRLTRLEWIYFMIFHTQRHIHQLKNIHKKVISRQIQLKEVRNV
jgi:hypothetical protein